MEPPIGDLTGEEYNRKFPQKEDSEKVYVRKGAAFQTDPDPPHDFIPVNRQLYGSFQFPINGSTPLPDNTGFAWTYITDVQQDPRHVMDMYAPEQLPILSTLARNFKVCDRW